MRTASLVSGLKDLRITTVYASAQKLLQVGREASRKPGRRRSDHVGKQVNVAVGSILATRNRAEEANISHAITSSHL